MKKRTLGYSLIPITMLSFMLSTQLDKAETLADFVSEVDGGSINVTVVVPEPIPEVIEEQPQEVTCPEDYSTLSEEEVAKLDPSCKKPDEPKKEEEKAPTVTPPAPPKTEQPKVEQPKAEEPAKEKPEAPVKEPVKEEPKQEELPTVEAPAVESNTTPAAPDATEQVSEKNGE